MWWLCSERSLTCCGVEVFGICDSCQGSQFPASDLRLLPSPLATPFATGFAWTLLQTCRILVCGRPHRLHLAWSHRIRILRRLTAGLSERPRSSESLSVLFSPGHSVPLGVEAVAASTELNSALFYTRCGSRVSECWLKEVLACWTDMFHRARSHGFINAPKFKSVLL